MFDSTQTGQLKTRADQTHKLLQDVRSWLSENLPASATGSRTQTCQETSKNNVEEPTYSCFELYEWADVEMPICSLASFALGQGEGGGPQTSPFTCNCPSSSPNAASPHRIQLEAYQCECPFLAHTSKLITSVPKSQSRRRPCLIRSSKCLLCPSARESPAASGS